MRKTLAIVFALVLCSLWSPAQAGEGYVGASYLSSTFEFQTTSGTSDAGSSGWNIYGGYKPMKFFAVEFTYYDMGSYNESDGTNSFKADVKVLDLSGRGILPLGERFELFARLGLSSVDVDFEETGGVLDTSAAGRGTEWLYGLGAGVNLGQKFGIRLEYIGWDVETSLYTWTLGGYFRFGGN